MSFGIVVSDDYVRIVVSNYSVLGPLFTQHICARHPHDHAPGRPPDVGPEYRPVFTGILPLSTKVPSEDQRDDDPACLHLSEEDDVPELHGLPHGAPDTVAATGKRRLRTLSKRLLRGPRTERIDQKKG
jgi:hypothetical protein